jgi:hypothetical protein
MATGAQVREQEKISLVALVLRSGGGVRLRVFGTSMLPSLWPGDVVTVESGAPDKFVLGDIALALGNNQFRAHRLLATTGVHWITRGDAMPQNDPPVELHDLLGRVVSVERNGRRFSPPPLSVTCRLLGQIFCSCDCIRGIALRLHAAYQNCSERKTAVEMSLRHA